MALQWFPGHMHKALKEIKESLNQVDILIEVLDARIPYSSETLKLQKYAAISPVLKFLISMIWQTQKLLRAESLEKERGVKTITTSSDNPGNSKQIMQLAKSICSYKEGQPKAIKAMITGIPNVGKSTLINILADRIIAKTGNEPAVTKSQQRINLGSGIILFDTPGVLWPKLENPHSIYR